MEKVFEGLKKHFIASTAIVFFYLPISASMEKIVGMSDLVSLNSRLIGALFVYLGIGILLTRTRGWSKKKLGIGEESKERVHYIYDMFFMGIFWLILRPFIYFISGEINLIRMALGTVTVVGMNFALGGLAGHFLDVYRDLAGTRKSLRVPEMIKIQNIRTKRIVALILVFISIIITALLYLLTPF